MIALLLTQIAYCQEKRDTITKQDQLTSSSQKLGYLGVMAGYSYQSDQSLKNISVADTTILVSPVQSGYNLQFNLDAPVGKGWSLALRFRNQTFRVNDDPILFQLRRVMPAYSWSMVSTSFQFKSISLGGVYAFTMTGKVSSFTRLMIGWGNITMPTLSIEGHRGDTSIFNSFSSNRVMVFNLILGGGFRYELSRALFLGLEADYQFNSWEYYGDRWSFNKNGNAYVNTPFKNGIKTIFPQRLYTGNLSFCIGYILR